MKHTLSLACALICAAELALPAQAAHIDNSALSFGSQKIPEQESVLTGICITKLPEPELGALMLGQRTLHPGDVLTAAQMEQMSFVAVGDPDEDLASIRYLPVFSDGLSGEATMTLSIRGKDNKAPIAEDFAMETYKNLEVTGKLRVRDPEGEPMQFTVTRQPKRGTVSIREDGTFTYTPKKNKVGIDSFTFTAADPAGKVSRETTVTVTILKPSDAKQYTDTSGRSCRFAAEWMKNTGIFIGESLDGNPCFSPDKPVSRGEFLTMLVKTLKLPTDAEVTETGYTDVPIWLRPYLAAALRSGLISGLPVQDTFNADEIIRHDEAARLLCSGLSLKPKDQAAISTDETGENAVAIAEDNGFPLVSGEPMTRGCAAELMYRISLFSEGKP